MEDLYSNCAAKLLKTSEAHKMASALSGQGMSANGAMAVSDTTIRMIGTPTNTKLELHIG